MFNLFSLLVTPYDLPLWMLFGYRKFVLTEAQIKGKIGIENHNRVFTKMFLEYFRVCQIYTVQC